jgi:hypothetical protein
MENKREEEQIAPLFLSPIEGEFIIASTIRIKYRW